MSYSNWKKYGFHRFKLENARFIKTDHCISGLYRGMVARLLVQWHLKQRIRIQRASKKTKPKVFNQLDIDFQFDSLIVYLFPMSPCTK